MILVRKKPIVVEAVQWTGSTESAREVMDWVGSGGGLIWLNDSFADPASLHIKTLEGIMEASPGDYVIRGIHGEHYPCKPNIFTATYERVDGRPL